MDHDNCPLTFLKALLNIIGGKGAISNINYYYYYYCYYYFPSVCHMAYILNAWSNRGVCRYITELIQHCPVMPAGGLLPLLNVRCLNPVAGNRESCPGHSRQKGTINKIEMPKPSSRNKYL